MLKNGPNWREGNQGDDDKEEEFFLPSSFLLHPSSLFQRFEVDTPEVDLGPFRLNHDLAVRQRGVDTGVDQLSVDEVLQVSFLDDGLQPRALAGG